MSTFLNINIEDTTPGKFRIKHMLFSISWLLIIFIVFLRLDTFVFRELSPPFENFSSFMPLIVVIISAIIFFTQKWYYKIAMTVYPLLAIFWFIPKFVLRNGKIFLAGQYLNFLYKKIKKPKQSISLLLLFVFTSLLLIILPVSIVRIFAIIVYTFFYCRYLISYVLSAFRPAEMFGKDVETELEKVVEQYKNKEESELLKSLIKEDGKDAELPEPEKKSKKLKKLVKWNFGIGILSKTLSGFHGKRAYTISFLLQFIFFIIITILYFTFANHQMYLSDNSNFLVTNQPGIFDFFYYSLKTMTFNGIDSIQPVSIFTKVLEMASYLIIGILVLVIIVSISFFLRQNKIQENINLVGQICESENKIIADYVEQHYGTTVDEAIKEVSDIKDSLEKIRKLIKSVF